MINTLNLGTELERHSEWTIYFDYSHRWSIPRNLLAHMFRKSCPAPNIIHGLFTMNNNNSQLPFGTLSTQDPWFPFL